MLALILPQIRTDRNIVNTFVLSLFVHTLIHTLVIRVHSTIHSCQTIFTAILAAYVWSEFFLFLLF